MFKTIREQVKNRQTRVHAMANRVAAESDWAKLAVDGRKRVCYSLEHSQG